MIKFINQLMNEYETNKYEEKKVVLGTNILLETRKLIKKKITTDKVSVQN